MARAMQSAGESGAVQEPRMSNVTLAFLEACCREEVSTRACSVHTPHRVSVCRQFAGFY